MQLKSFCCLEGDYVLPPMYAIRKTYLFSLNVKCKSLQYSKGSVTP